MGLLLLVSFLLAYNNLLNLWPPFNRWAYVPLNLATTGTLVWIALMGFGLPPEDLGIAPPERAAALGLGLAVAATLPLFVLALGGRTRRFVADQRVAHLGGLGVAYQTLLRIPIGTALLEEVAFRGVLFAALQHLGDLPAAMWSSLVFGLWHVGPTRNLVQANRPGAGRARTGGAIALAVLGTGIAGLGFVWLRIVTGSLWAPWALHAGLNALATLAAVAAHRRRREDA